jgi:hypothetical protein
VKIFIEFDDGIYRLMCDDNRMRPMPAGARLFRAQPHPEMKFSHSTIEEAEEDAQKLRRYLEQLAPKKPTKKQQREYIS